MRVVITGATGFVGRNLAEGLHRDGLSVEATGRSFQVGRELDEQGITFRSADLRDAARLVEAIGPADVLVHCAAKTGDWGSERDFFDANVFGTRNVIRACRERGIRKIVFVSTPSVYFDGTDRYGIREDEPLPARMSTAYARTKRRAEEELLALGDEGVRVIVLRPRAVYGPHDQTIVPRILKLAEGKRLPLIGGGRARVDVTYIGNVVDVVRACLQAPDEAWGEVYNVSNGDPVTVRRWFAQVLEVFERPFRPLELPEPVAQGLAVGMELLGRLPFGPEEPSLTRFSVGYMGKSMTLSIEKAREKLGWEPRVGNREGFERYAAWVHRQAAGA